MSFLYRLGFYLGGFSVGLVFLFFILNGKKTQCHYGPQARVLNDLSKKPWTFDGRKKQYDSLAIRDFLKNAKVDFLRSETQRDSCKVYFLEGFYQKKKWALRVENCKKTVIVIEEYTP